MNFKGSVVGMKLRDVTDNLALLYCVLDDCHPSKFNEEALSGMRLTVKAAQKDFAVIDKYCFDTARQAQILKPTPTNTLNALAGSTKKK